LNGIPESPKAIIKSKRGTTRRRVVFRRAARSFWKEKKGEKKAVVKKSKKNAMNTIGSRPERWGGRVQRKGVVFSKSRKYYKRSGQRGHRAVF